MFGNDADIGLDPHFLRNPDTDRLIAISIDDKYYELEECLHMVERLIGRGTKV